MILVKNVLVHCVSGVIGGSSFLIYLYCLSNLMLLLFWCMWPLDVASDGGRFLLIRLIVKFGHVK